MALPDIFLLETTQSLYKRLDKLNSTSTPSWGKMSVGQMLAHCCVTYEMVYEDIHPKPNFIMRFMLKSFVKSTVTNEIPYKHNGQTAPAFVIKEDKDFDVQMKRLKGYMEKTLNLGAPHFEGKESLSFGKLNTQEWNNMFYKHLDHHLTQFGV